MFWLAYFDFFCNFSQIVNARVCTTDCQVLPTFAKSFLQVPHFLPIFPKNTFFKGF